MEEVKPNHPQRVTVRFKEALHAIRIKQVLMHTEYSLRNCGLLANIATYMNQSSHPSQPGTPPLPHDWQKR